MADHSDNILRATIKALSEVVMPAVDPADPLASEQLRLAIGFLKVLRGRLPLVHARERFELRHQLDMGARVADDAARVSADAASRLATALQRGRALQQRADASMPEMRAASAEIAAALSSVVRFAAFADAPVRQRIEQSVLAASKAMVDMQRAWHLAQGFELNPEQVPDLERALKAVQDP